MTDGNLSRRKVIGGAAATTAALAANPLRARESTVHEVAISTFTFDPQHLQVHVGDKIRWTNHDLAPHTATAEQFSWDTGEIAKGETVEVIVTAGMETSYFCAFHSHMTGTIEV